MHQESLQEIAGFFCFAKDLRRQGLCENSIGSLHELVHVQILQECQHLGQSLPPKSCWGQKIWKQKTLFGTSFNAQIWKNCHFTLDFTGRCAKKGTENNISIILRWTAKILYFQMPRMDQNCELTTNINKWSPTALTGRWKLQAPQELTTKFAQALQAHPLAVEK